MAREGRCLAECARRRPGVHHNALRESPRAGCLDTQRSGGLSRRCAVSTRQWHPEGGCRAIWGGRAHVREALYMATLVATRSNPVIRAFYQRLCQAGKAKKLALTACMRKLLTILNAMLKSGTPWRVAVSQPT
ncbi:MAG: hypothetical protein LZF86_110004 [Nitrospira sp.]|nr:MAG: hypothetical protein LZF86_110004 [Nitrospira sp.]